MAPPATQSAPGRCHESIQNKIGFISQDDVKIDSSSCMLLFTKKSVNVFIHSLLFRIYFYKVMSGWTVNVVTLSTRGFISIWFFSLCIEVLCSFIQRRLIFVDSRRQFTQAKEDLQFG